jgi:hypothetical protein
MTTTTAAEKFDAIIALENRPRKAAELAVAMASMDATEQAEFATYREADKAARRAEEFSRQEARLNTDVEELNTLLGLAADAPHRVTIGYIGNGRLTSTGWDLSDVRWSVYLPHPGRVGTDADCVASWSTGSLEGVVAARRALAAVVQGVRLARSI